MQLVDFCTEHIEEARALAQSEYQRERAFVPMLPEVAPFPSLEALAKNGLGVAAFEGGRMVGFFACYDPVPRAFTTNASGVFSPVHAHAAEGARRGELYARMYEASAQKWVERGIASHSVGLFAQDKEAVDTFFHYSFGLRCMDAMRQMEPLFVPEVLGYAFMELDAAEVKAVAPLRYGLAEHIGRSPAFMKRSALEISAWIMEAEAQRSRLFVATFQGEVIAYAEVKDGGENYITNEESVQNICGAFCRPEHRGKRVYENLLNHVIAVLRAEGYTRLGVDFESINPSACRFWLKYFTAYTYGVVRRVDESALGCP